MSLRLTLRVAAPSIVISLLLLILGGLGGWYVLNLQKRTAALVALDMATMRSVQQLVLSITEARAELAEFLATGDRAHLEAVPVKCEQIEHWLRATEDLVDDDEEIALATRIRDGFRRFLAESRDLPKAPLNHDIAPDHRAAQQRFVRARNAGASEGVAHSGRRTKPQERRLQSGHGGPDRHDPRACWQSAGRRREWLPASESPGA